MGTDFGLRKQCMPGTCARSHWRLGCFELDLAAGVRRRRSAGATKIGNHDWHSVVKRVHYAVRAVRCRPRQGRRYSTWRDCVPFQRSCFRAGFSRLQMEGATHGRPMAPGMRLPICFSARVQIFVCSRLFVQRRKKGRSCLRLPGLRLSLPSIRQFYCRQGPRQGFADEQSEIGGKRFLLRVRQIVRRFGPERGGCLHPG